MIESDLTERIIRCALNVHSKLGPGLLESSYEECLNYELVKEGMNVEKQKPLPLIYKGIKLEIGYRVDLFVEDKVIIEVKAVETFNEVHLAQVITYLKLSGCKVGLLINFNVKHLRNGIKRVIV
ncbi:MAG: GxxExxY protein [Bacteroidetes bacterium]|nr:GxxExxY protein [Bacteroidota bacterium]